MEVEDNMPENHSISDAGCSLTNGQAERVEINADREIISFVNSKSLDVENEGENYEGDCKSLPVGVNLEGETIEFSADEIDDFSKVVGDLDIFPKQHCFRRPQLPPIYRTLTRGSRVKKSACTSPYNVGYKALYEGPIRRSPRGISPGDPQVHSNLCNSTSMDDFHAKKNIEI